MLPSWVLFGVAIFAVTALVSQLYNLGILRLPSAFEMTTTNLLLVGVIIAIVGVGVTYAYNEDMFKSEAQLERERQDRITDYVVDRFLKPDPHPYKRFE